MGSVYLLLTGYRKGISVYEKVLKDPLPIVIISPSLRPNKEQSVIPFAKSRFKLAIFTTLTPATTSNLYNFLFDLWKWPD